MGSFVAIFGCSLNYEKNLPGFGWLPKQKSAAGFATFTPE
jgi:hypothetical protein